MDVMVTATAATHAVLYIALLRRKLTRCDWAIDGKLSPFACRKRGGKDQREFTGDLSGGPSPWTEKMGKDMDDAHDVEWRVDEQIKQNPVDASRIQPVNITVFSHGMLRGHLPYFHHRLFTLFMFPHHHLHSSLYTDMSRRFPTPTLNLPRPPPPAHTNGAAKLSLSYPELPAPPFALAT